MRRKRLVLGVAVTQQASQLVAQLGQCRLAGGPLYAVLTAKPQRQAEIDQFQQLGVTLGISHQIFGQAEEPLAGIDIAVERHHQRQAGPARGAAPRRVDGDIVKKRRNEPRGLVGAGQRNTGSDCPVTGIGQIIEQSFTQNVGVIRRGCTFKFGGHAKQDRKRVDQRVVIRALFTQTHRSARCRLTGIPSWITAGRAAWFGGTLWLLSLASRPDPGAPGVVFQPKWIVPAHRLSAHCIAINFGFRVELASHAHDEALRVVQRRPVFRGAIKLKAQPFTIIGNFARLGMKRFQRNA